MAWSITLNGNTYTDADLAKYGYVTRLPAMLADLALEIAARVAEMVGYRDLAQAAAQTAINAPGTAATSTTSLTIGTGPQSLTIQTGKALVSGMTIKAASAANPANWMHGDLTAYDSGTGALSFTCSTKSGSGTFADWVVSLSAPTGLPSPVGQAGKVVCSDGEGYAFKLLRDGAETRVSGIIRSAISLSSMETGSQFNVTACKLDATHFLCLYSAPSTQYLTAVVITKDSEGVLVSAAANTLNAASSTYIGVCALSSTAAVVAYQVSGNFYAAALTITGNSVSIGTPVSLTATGYYPVLKAVDATTALILYRDGTANDTRSRTLSVSASTITANAATTLDAATGDSHDLVMLSATTAVAFRRTASVGRASVLTISGTAVTNGAAIAVDAVYANSLYFSASAIDAARVFVAYENGQNYPSAVVLSVAGDIITRGTPVTIGTTTSGGFLMGIATSETRATVLRYVGTTLAQAIAVDLSIDGVTLALGGRRLNVAYPGIWRPHTHVPAAIMLDGEDVVFAAKYINLDPSGYYALLARFAPPYDIVLTSDSAVAQEIASFAPVILPSGATLDAGAARFVLRCKAGGYPVRNALGDDITRVHPGEAVFCQLVDAAADTWDIAKMGAVQITPGAMLRNDSQQGTSQMTRCAALDEARYLTSYRNQSDGSQYFRAHDLTGGYYANNGFGTVWVYNYSMLTESIFIAAKATPGVRAYSISPDGSISSLGGADTAIAGMLETPPPVVKRIDNSRALLVYKGASNYLYARILTWDGTALAAGVETKLSGGTKTVHASSYYQNNAVELVAATKGIAFYTDATSQYMWAVPFTISGTAITAGTERQVAPFGSFRAGFDVCAIGGDGILMACCASNQNYGYALTFKTDGVTVSHSLPMPVNANSQLDQFGGAVKLQRIDDARVVVAFPADNGNMEAIGIRLSLLYVNDGYVTPHGIPVLASASGSEPGGLALVSPSDLILAANNGSTNTYSQRIHLNV